MKTTQTFLLLIFMVFNICGQNNPSIIDFEIDTLYKIKYLPSEGRSVDNVYMEDKYGVLFFLDSIKSENVPVISKVGDPATAIWRDRSEYGTQYLDSTWGTKADLPNGTEDFGYYFLTDDGKIVRHPKNIYLDFNNEKVSCSRLTGYILDVDGPERWVINVYGVSTKISPVQSKSICMLNEGYWPSRDCDIPANGHSKGTFWEINISPDSIDYVEFQYDEEQSFYRPVGLAFDNFTIYYNNLENYYSSNDVNWDSVDIGKQIILENVEFEFNKSRLEESSFPELDKLAKYLKDNAYFKLEISGHADNIGETSFNKQLSLDRAMSVVDYLTSKGIDKTRLKAIGFGNTKPIVKNDTDKNRQKNRRVEFKLIK